MKHKVYKITNLLDEKFYIGVTKGTLDKRFKGHSKSESHIGRAIRKYGTENFLIEEIHSFESKEESYNKEAELVNEDFLKREDVYNKKLGGNGGFDHINVEGNPNWSKEHLTMMSELGKVGRIDKLIWLYKNDQEWVDNLVAKRINTRYEKYGSDAFNTFEGKVHSEETKKKIGEANSKHQQGTGNSQFGTMWIHNLEEKLSKKIKKDELPEYESIGWLKGRKMKF